MSKTATIGNILRKHREKAQVSQREIAEAMGLQTYQMISNVERGLYKPPKAKIKIWAEKIGLDVKKLVKAMVDDYRAELEKCL